MADPGRCREEPGRVGRPLVALRTGDPERTTPTEPSRPLVTATGSKPLDLAVFGALVLLLLVSTPRLRVYHRITVMEVRVERVYPDGTTHAIATPNAVGTRRLALTTPDAALPRLSDQIRQYMRTSPMMREAVPGERVRWTIRYAYNSPQLDREAEIVVER